MDFASTAALPPVEARADERARTRRSACSAAPTSTTTIPGKCHCVTSAVRAGGRRSVTRPFFRQAQGGNRRKMVELLPGPGLLPYRQQPLCHSTCAVSRRHGRNQKGHRHSDSSRRKLRLNGRHSVRCSDPNAASKPLQKEHRGCSNVSGGPDNLMTTPEGVITYDHRDQTQADRTRWIHPGP
jgi:hypothetical protein